MATLVQSKIIGAPFADDWTGELDSPPTVGNLLVLTFMPRSSNQAEATCTLITDPFSIPQTTVAFDKPAHGSAHDSGGGGGSVTIFWHRVTLSDVAVDANPSIQVTGGGAGTCSVGVVMEWADVSDADVTAEVNAGTTDPHFNTGSVTPTVADFLLIAAATVQTDDPATSAAVTPDASYTEVLDARGQPNLWPNGWTAYRIVTGGSGAYNPGGTITDGSATNLLPYGGQTVAFALAGAEPEPPAVHVDVNGVRIERAKDKKVRFELNKTGEFHFVIDRNDVQATEANFFRGALVEIYFTEIHSGVLFEGILEEGDFTLISSDEEGGEELSFGGRGSLAMLENALIGFEDLTLFGGAYPDDGVWRWAADASGAILRRLIDEAKERTPDPLPGVTTPDPGGDPQDSLGNPWDVIHIWWTSPMGTDILSELQNRLIPAGGLFVEMRPGLTLYRYNTYGTDRTGGAFGAGVVRFVKGVNIADSLSRRMSGTTYATDALVKTMDGWEWAPRSAGSSSREVFIDLSGAQGGDTVDKAVEQALADRDDAQGALLLQVAYHSNAHAANDEANGFYYPGPTWSDNGKYWLGDLVTLHTGAGEFDYTNEAKLVRAITLMEDPDVGGLAMPIVELEAPWPSTEGVGPSTPSLPNGGATGGSTVTGGGYHEHLGYVTTSNGGGETVLGHGNLGATETIDLVDGNYHTGTLTADCTFTFTAPLAGRVRSFTLRLTEDGTGGWNPTWPASVVWPGGVAPTHDTTAGTTSFYVFHTIDGGTTWYGFPVGGGTELDPATTVEAETTFGLSSAVGTDVEYARQDHTHGTPANPVTAAAVTALGFVGPILISDTHSTPLVFDDLLQNSDGDDLLYLAP